MPFPFLQQHYNNYRERGGSHQAYVVVNELSDTTGDALKRAYETSTGHTEPRPVPALDLVLSDIKKAKKSDRNRRYYTRVTKPRRQEKSMAKKTVALALVKTKKSKALAPATAVSQELIRAGNALKALAQLVSENSLARHEEAKLFTDITTYQTALAATQELLKKRLVDFVEMWGTQVTDKGTRRLEEDGWRLEVRPWRTGVDSAKLEALLRTKSLDPGVAMDSEVRWKANGEKVAAAVASKTLTQDEVDSCNYDHKPVLQAPVKVMSDDRGGDSEG